MPGRDFLLIADAVAPLGRRRFGAGRRWSQPRARGDRPPHDGSDAGQRRRRRAASPDWRAGCGPSPRRRRAHARAHAVRRTRAARATRNCWCSPRRRTAAPRRPRCSPPPSGRWRTTSSSRPRSPSAGASRRPPRCRRRRPPCACSCCRPGASGPSLAPPEAEILGPLLLGDESASHSLVALGCLGANAIVAPSPSAARATESDPGLASRASDEPVIAVRFGCDDPPNDPGERPGAARELQRRRRFRARRSAGARSRGAARWRSARGRCC